MPATAALIKSIRFCWLSRGSNLSVSSAHRIRPQFGSKADTALRGQSDRQPLRGGGRIDPGLDEKIDATLRGLHDVHLHVAALGEEWRLKREAWHRSRESLCV